MSNRPGPAPGEKFTELSSGQFTYYKTDLTLPGAMPIMIKRVYRSRDYTSSGAPIACNFGLGARVNYDIFLYSYSARNSSPTYTDAEVVLPDGGELACGRVQSTCTDQSCTDYTGTCSENNPAVFTCNEQPSGIWFNSTLTYNCSNAGWDLKRKDGTVYHFGSNSLLQTITDRFSNSITITRGGQELANCANPGQTISSSDIAVVSSSDGRSVNFCYDAVHYAHGISRIFDSASGPNGQPAPIKQVDYTYNDNGALATATYTSYSPYATTTYQYQQTPYAGVADLTTIITNMACTSTSGCSPSQNYTYIGYGPDEYVNSVSNSVPSVGFQFKNYTGSNSNNIPPNDYNISAVVETLPDGTQRSLTFDVDGYLTKDVRNAGTSNTETAVFNRGIAVGNTSEFIGSVYEEDSSGAIWRSTQYNWDTTYGDLLSVAISPPPGTLAAGADNNLHSVATWSYSYEPLYHRLASFAEPLSNKPTTIAYNDAADNYVVTDPLNRYTTVSYNGQGQVKAVTDEYGASAVTTYNGYGDIASSADPAGDVTQYQTDADGRVTAVTSPLNETTSYQLDAEDHVTQRTDPAPSVGAAQPVTTYTYDLIGLLHKVTTPNGNPTTYQRTATLSSLTITDALGHQAVVNFDATGRTQTYTDKLGNVTTYSYDAFGRLKGFSTAMPYNCSTGIPYQQRQTAYQYDPLDRVAQMTETDYDCVQLYDYITHTQTFTYTYDGIDDVLSESQNTSTQPAAQPNSAITYAYDLNGRRTSAQLAVNGTSLPAVSYLYDYADELVDMANGGPLASPNPSSDCHTGDGSQVSFCYDNDGRRTGLASSGVQTQYAYDAASRLTGLTYSNANGTQYGNLTYGFDKDSQVTDKGGTLATVGMPESATASYSAIDQVSSWSWNGGSAQAAGVDNAGNITTDPADGNSYAWDVRNELQTVSGSSAAMVYDALGRRENSPYGFGGAVSGAAQSYLYDGSQAIQSSGADGTIINYLRGPGSGEMLMESVAPAGAPQVPLVGANGSTIALVDSASGNVVATYTYDPFGNVTSVTGSGYANGYQYQAMENDQWEDYGGHMNYSPLMGRMLSLNGPLASGGGYNSGLAGAITGVMPPGAAGGSNFGDYVAQNTEDEAAGTAAGFAAGGLVASAFLGSDIGWAGGPPGALAGFAIGGLISLFQDILGGGPSLPAWQVRELEYVGGSVEAWRLVEGMLQGRVPMQEPSAGVQETPALQESNPVSDSSPPAPGIVPVQFPGYNYCGPGNNGVATQPGTVDDCCRQHDNCYGKAGLSFRNMGTPGAGATPAQQACDRQLCQCVGAAGVTRPSDSLMKWGIQIYFGCR